nr:HalOD1 output domain-containing protein [Haladaptatus halobius]
MSTRVVTAVATREQLSADELEPLYDYIDPEALDTCSNP